jgi:hypothetical protein
MLLDIMAVVLGVLYTVRKLDVRKREAEQFPHVPADEFERWRSLESGAYTLASMACFAKVLLDYGFVLYARSAQLDPRVIRAVGASLFAAWIAALIVSQVRARSARKLRDRLGIDLAVRKPLTP